MNHVADNVTYWHDLHYAPPSTLAGRWHKKEKKERGEKRADTLEKRNPTRGRVGCVGAGKWKRGQRHAQHVEPHMARGFPLLKARLT